MEKPKTKKRSLYATDQEWEMLINFMRNNNIEAKPTTFIMDIVKRVISNQNLYQLVQLEGIFSMDIPGLNGDHVLEDIIRDAVEKSLTILKNNELLEPCIENDDY